jgi:hypothetical protein
MDVERIVGEKYLKGLLDSGRDTFTKKEVEGAYDIIRKKYYPEPEWWSPLGAI